MSINLPLIERDVLDFWRAGNIFKKIQKKNEKADTFVFYDGPPFATGTPHHGHLTASTIKDVVGRYWSMRGKNVPRRWGWDCHGLPIEGEIIKKLKMTPEQAVAKLGVAGYNQECRSIVDRYTAEWQDTIERLGRWVDFDNCYRTMDPEYMESVWWVFKQLWDKGLVYQGTKVLPFSTALSTPLANFEASSNYKVVQDPAIAVLFEKEGNSQYPTYFMAWTTTPWTLPSNLALAVNSNIDYVEVLISPEKLPASAWAEDIVVVLAKDCLEYYPELKTKSPDGDHFNILRTFPGSELVGNKYNPLVGSFVRSNSHQILAGDFVRTNTGTGIVHLAPAFGEDDYWACNEAGIEPVCPVDEMGQFTSEITAYEGLHVKDADKQIIQDLKKVGVILRHGTISHSYPHCPRTDTPLIYKLVPCWYIAVEKIKDKLLAANSQTSWVPGHIKEGRFGSWLENARDWCVSRNRVWGTPIPIWINDVSGKTICVGSRQELMVMAGVSPSFGKTPAETIPDLHREFIDDFEFTVPGEEGIYRRIPEIFDCWFESGAMPYAQRHHPFEDSVTFHDNFPADFIAEGQDQTRGWFYTLTVLSAALYDSPAFKNVIVNGIVLAADGKKMAKRLKNYTDPKILLDNFGADALRLYLLNSGLMRAEDLKFKDEDIKDSIKSLLLPWYNANKFFTTYAEIDGWTTNHLDDSGNNLLDQWIQEECDDLVGFLNKEFEAYRLYNMVPRIVQFMDSLTNTYIRLNRRRFWGEGLPKDKCQGYTAYYGVLNKLASALAPITPFLAEHLYQELLAFNKDAEAEESVHLSSFPQKCKDVSDMLQATRLMQQIILLGRKKREEANISLKTPLQGLKIIHRDQNILDSVAYLENYIKTELNVKKVAYHQDENNYIEIYAKPNFRRLGKRLGAKMANFKAMIESLSQHALALLEQEGFIVLAEERFTTEDINVSRRPKPGMDTLANSAIGIELDCNLTSELIREGVARKVVNIIQNLRKKSGFDLTDRIKISYWTEGETSLAVQTHKDYIMGETLCLKLTSDPKTKHEKQFQIDKENLYLKISKA